MSVTKLIPVSSTAFICHCHWAPPRTVGQKWSDPALSSTSCLVCWLRPCLGLEQPGQNTAVGCKSSDRPLGWFYHFLWVGSSPTGRHVGGIAGRDAYAPKFIQCQNRGWVGYSAQGNVRPVQISSANWKKLRWAGKTMNPLKPVPKRN